MRTPIVFPGQRVIAVIAIRVASAILFAGLCVMPWSDSEAQVGTPAIDFRVISAGGQTLKNGCFQLSGTVGQVAPGFSSNASSAVFAGYWAVALPLQDDRIFFNGFEDC